MKTAPLCRIACLLAAFVVAGIGLPPAASQTTPAPAVRDLYSDTWVATDALGRTTPTFDAGAPAPRKDRFVGIFYFLTQGSEEYYKDSSVAQKDYSTYGDDPRVLRDNTQIIQQVGGDSVTKPAGWKDAGVYWWGEPAVGYFLADDPWVARKNLRMLADAGVDVIIFDVTNGPEYWNTLHTLLGTAEEMRAERLATPQFAFITHASSGVVANQLYDHIYAKRLYKNLWFTWQGKPLIFGDPVGSAPDNTPARPEVASFFTWRDSWANTKGPRGNGQDEWEWADAGDPQVYGWHGDPKKPEEVPVLVGGWANADIGRSYQGGGLTPWGAKGAEPPLNKQDVAADVDKGLFFAEQWNNALKIDPEFIWVTGWNEWTAGRQYGPGVPMLGHVTKPGQYYFVDEYDEEFSRDAMPMKGGFGDDYFMQLIENVRRFKGARPLPVAHGFHTMPLGRFVAWQPIQPDFRNAVGDSAHRDWDGWGGLHYVNNTGRNDIVEAKVACDAANIYFYARTEKTLTPATGANWMQLLIDTDPKHPSGWNGYDFVVNSRVIDSTTTTLKDLRSGRVATVRYFAQASQMQVTIPRRLLGLTDPKETSFDFHWLDNVPVGGDPKSIADWWYVGDSAPDGRFNYRYQNIR